MTNGLVADIGGTHARLALVTKGGALIDELQIFANRDFESLELLIEDYLKRFGKASRPRKACFAVASPVLSDHIKFTNNTWSFHREELRQTLGFESLHVMNDFEAVARSLPHLSPAALKPIGALKPDPARKNRDTLSVVGPGTGLGTGALLPIGEGRFRPIPSEGGHSAFSPQDERESYLVEALKREKGLDFVCNEDFLSGQGMEAIYRLLSLRSDANQAKRKSSREIIEGAVNHGEALCLETLACFSAMLGSVAGDMALTFGARGGLFLAGGILPRMLTLFESSAFRSRFESKGAYSYYTSAIPTCVIIGSEPGLIGARSFLMDEEGV